MLITEVTQENIPQWLVLAAELEPLFQGSMVKNDKFHAYMQAKIEKREAFMAVDRAHDKVVMGIIGFSHTHNRITWFAVFERYRNKGIGAQLLKCALNQLDGTKEITVTTFREGYEPGQPARHLYQKFEFVDTDSAISDDQGNPRCIMTRFPDPTVCAKNTILTCMPELFMNSPQRIKQPRRTRRKDIADFQVHNSQFAIRNFFIFASLRVLRGCFIRCVRH